MAKDIVTKAEILGGEIDVRANFGQTVKVTVSPDPYMGDTEVTPSAETQVLATKKKFVQDDITVYPAPTEVLSTDHNGTFTPSEGKVGFSAVTVDVNPDLRPLSVSENGTYQPDGFDGYSSVTADIEPNLTSLSVTENGLYLPESGTDGFDRVNVNVPIPTFETEEKTVTENGIYLPSAGKDGISKVTVDVPSQAPVLDSLSVTDNGTYTPSAGIDGFDEVVVNVPTGGGGGLTLIDTIEVNWVNGVQVDIDTSWFDDADYVLLVPDLTFSASDWLYVIADATSGGNTYADRRTSAVPSQAVFISRAVGTISVTWLNGRQVAGYMSPSYLYWYLYYASTTMTGTIKIYGIKVTS